MCGVRLCPSDSETTHIAVSKHGRAQWAKSSRPLVTNSAVLAVTLVSLDHIVQGMSRSQRYHNDMRGADGVDAMA
jgi:hypothetical protein